MGFSRARHGLRLREWPARRRLCGCDPDADVPASPWRGSSDRNAGRSSRYRRLSLTRQAFSRFLLIDAAVELNPDRGKTFKLREEDLRRIESSPSGPEEFRRTCGDHYIRSVWRGGDFKAVLHFKSRTQSEASSVESALRGTAGGIKPRQSYANRSHALPAPPSWMCS